MNGHPPETDAPTWGLSARKKIRPQGYRWSRWLFKTLLRSAGWQVRGSAIPRNAVIIAGPHTSNVDFLVLVGAAWSLGAHARFLAKASLFRPPLGWLLRAMGGVPVRRGEQQGLVSVARGLLERNAGPVALLPSGTRSKAPWKRGFLHMAGREYPIYLMTCDYARRQVTVFGPKYAHDHAEVMRWARENLSGVRGRHPENEDLYELKPL